jgi:hypothetical protein
LHEHIHKKIDEVIRWSSKKKVNLSHVVVAIVVVIELKKTME